MAQPPERRGSGVNRLEHPTQIPDPEGHPIIPPLRNFAPAIFRPISYDEPLSDITSVTRLDHLKAQLKSIDDHAQSSRKNFVALCIRERERILQEGRRCEVLDKQEDTVSPDVPLGVESDTLDSMISNMEAKPQRSARHANTRDLPIPLFNKHYRSLRECQASKMMGFVSHSTLEARNRDRTLRRHRDTVERNIREHQRRAD
ncbi:uncharacterized protein FIESC28_08319 [Fusarium coffeatum]|uniref:Uncharacterized protein n=1 Tax=Fusarium coffeatum TaxID=231269 RepID=A0A366R7L8_9HYPO|nr:uncharacterized protein FIESC28_08319 [Fusarium coffeatum]RBR13133.1 hypothetical protein FIESC28_08319 [Fusarium coffeatum]